MTAFSAAAMILFAVGAAAFGVVAITSERSFSTFFLLIMCLSGSFLTVYLLWANRRQFFSWGLFLDHAVRILTLFCRESVLDYDECKGCGIGVYRQALLNDASSPLGTNYAFLFLSLKPFPEEYRTRINLWKPSEQQIKVQFDRKLYEYLLSVLPKKQAARLESDYRKYIEGK